MNYDTLEVAPEKYFIDEVTYNEARMYCFMLSVDGEFGWRLPTYNEIEYLRRLNPDVYGLAIVASDALVYEQSYRLTVVPVRDTRCAGT